MSSVLSYVQPTANSPWGTYLSQVDRVIPYLGDLARWAETLKRPKRALIVDVPIELDNGQVLTEGPAIIQYLADQKPEAGLAPKNGSLERYRLQEWLNILTSEIHKGFSPLFKPNTPEEYKTISKGNLATRFDWLDKQLAGKDYLTGKAFTVADAYLFVLLNWTKFQSIDLNRWPNLAAFQARVGARPKVQEALQFEGLLKKAA